MNHIKNTNNDFAWCGEDLTKETAFYFKDIEQATVNGLHGSRAMCGCCINAIIECLEKPGKCYNED